MYVVGCMHMNVHIINYNDPKRSFHRITLLYTSCVLTSSLYTTIITCTCHMWGPLTTIACCISAQTHAQWEWHNSLCAIYIYMYILVGVHFSTTNSHMHVNTVHVLKLFVTHYINTSICRSYTCTFFLCVIFLNNCMYAHVLLYLVWLCGSNILLVCTAWVQFCEHAHIFLEWIIRHGLIIIGSNLDSLHVCEYCC